MGEQEGRVISEKEEELLNTKALTEKTLNKMLDKKMKLDADIECYYSILELVEKELAEVQG